MTPADLLNTMNMHRGENLQVRIPLELKTRDYLTELNHSSQPVRGIFYEGTQPRLVNLISIQNLTCDLPHFQFDMTVCGKFCVHRFVDDLGLQLGTFARVNQLFLNTFSDMTVDDCLQKHELYKREIEHSLEFNRRKYRKIMTKYSELGDRSAKFVSPWS